MLPQTKYKLKKRIFSFLLIAVVAFFTTPIFGLAEKGEFTVVEKIPYWEKGAYDTFPSDSLFVEDRQVSRKFESVQQKYDSHEFNYDEQKVEGLSFFERVKNWLNQFLESFLPDWGGISETTVLYLLIALAVFAILFTLYKLFFSRNKSVQRKVKESEEADFKFVERNLENVSIDEYLQEAIQKQQWDVAIRYLHLQNLQLLAKKGIIVWDYRKTNQEFLLEIKDEKIKENFRKTTTLFNYVWFGKFDIDQATFDTFQTDFIRFKNELI